MRPPHSPVTQARTRHATGLAANGHRSPPKFKYTVLDSATVSHLVKKIALAALMLALASCAGVKPTTPTATPSFPTVTEPTPAIAIIEITCDGDSDVGYETFWTKSRSLDLSYCDAEVIDGNEFSENDRLAAATAGYASVSEVTSLYALCAEVEGDYATKDTELSEDQIKEAKGMLTLCPNFPRADVVRANIKLTTILEHQRSAGQRFSDGDYRVKKDIQPGTYFVPKSDDTGCYWERLDRNGNIIANHITMGRTRVQVTIHASDYSFSSERCGEWRRVK